MSAIDSVLESQHVCLTASTPREAMVTITVTPIAADGCLRSGHTVRLNALVPSGRELDGLAPGQQRQRVAHDLDVSASEKAGPSGGAASVPAELREKVFGLAVELFPDGCAARNERRFLDVAQSALAIDEDTARAIAEDVLTHGDA